MIPKKKDVLDFLRHYNEIDDRICNVVNKITGCNRIIINYYYPDNSLKKLIINYNIGYARDGGNTIVIPVSVLWNENDLEKFMEENVE